MNANVHFCIVIGILWMYSRHTVHLLFAFAKYVNYPGKGILQVVNFWCTKIKEQWIIFTFFYVWSVELEFRGAYMYVIR
jgi:hypothetical protein